MIKQKNKNLIIAVLLVLALFLASAMVTTDTQTANGASNPYVNGSSMYASGTQILITDGVGYNTSGYLLSYIYFGYAGSGDLTDPANYLYCFVDTEDSTVEFKVASTRETLPSSYDLSTFSIYGGGYTRTGDYDVYANTCITMTGGNVLKIYGGGNDGNVEANTYVHISGGTVGTGFATGYVYGGGKTGKVTGNTYVTITEDARILGYVFGGGDDVSASVVGSTNITIYGGSEIIGSIYAGGNDAPCYGTTNLTITDSFVGTEASEGYIFGGGFSGAIYGTTNVTINGDSVIYGNIYGGGNTIASTINGYNNNGAVTTVTIAGNTEITGYVFGGSNASAINDYISPATYLTSYGTSHVIMTGGTVDYIFGGSASGISTKTDVDISGGTVGTVYGGSDSGTVTYTNVEIGGDAVVGTIYGGGNGLLTGGEVILETNIEISDNAKITNNIYGGGYKSMITGNAAADAKTNITIDGGTVLGYVFGGGNLQGASVGSDEYAGNTYITVTGGTTSNLYGGGFNDAVYGDSYITVSGGSVSSIYGGGLQGLVENATITLKGGSIVSANVKHYVSGDKAVVISLTDNLYFSGVLGTSNSDGSVSGITTFTNSGYTIYSNATPTSDVAVAYFTTASTANSALSSFKFADSTVDYTFSAVSEETVHSITAYANSASNAWIWWLLIVAILLGGALCLFLVYKDKKRIYE